VGEEMGGGVDMEEEEEEEEEEEVKGLVGNEPVNAGELYMLGMCANFEPNNVRKRVIEG
jgi:hypothetical protein